LKAWRETLPRLKSNTGTHFYTTRGFTQFPETMPLQEDHQTTPMTAAASMYESAMGERFGRLTVPVQRFHRLSGRHILHGLVRVHAPASIPARLLARLLGTPLMPGEGPIKFELDAHPLAETWTRHFSSNVLVSRLQLHGPYLVEKIRAARLTFELCERDGQLCMSLRRLHFFGIPCPAFLMPLIRAEETGGADNRLHFHISAEVRHVGLVAQYHGYLLLPEPHAGRGAA
jgi:Domain of unknown function (DUF4166)